MRPIRIAHVSDIHYTFGGVHEPETFSKGVEAVNGEGADLVIASGDLTDWGLRPEFEGVRAQLERFDAPVLTCLGNHDARREGWRVYCELFRERYYRERVKDVDVIVLDSSQPDLDEGEVGREQRTWLEGELRQARFPIVVLHHHTVPIPNTGREINVLRDAGGVLYVLDQFDVPLVLGGHRHYPWAWEINQMLVSHAGTFSSNKRNWPPSYNVVDVGPDGIRVEHVQFLDGRRRAIAEVPLPRRWGGSQEKRMRPVIEGGMKPLT